VTFDTHKLKPGRYSIDLMENAAHGDMIVEDEYTIKGKGNQ
jgi:hypothetical protein